MTRIIFSTGVEARLERKRDGSLDWKVQDPKGKISREILDLRRQLLSLATRTILEEVGPANGDPIAYLLFRMKKMWKVRTEYDPPKTRKIEVIY